MIKNLTDSKKLEYYSDVFCDCCNEKIDGKRFYDVFINFVALHEGEFTHDSFYGNEEEPLRQQFCQKCYKKRYEVK